MREEWVALYRHVPPTVQPIPVEVHPFLVEEIILEEEKIAWVVRRICLNHLVGLLGVIGEHLCQWLIAETWDDTPDSTNWHKVVAIVQAVLRDRTLATIP